MALYACIIMASKPLKPDQNSKQIHGGSSLITLSTVSTLNDNQGISYKQNTEITEVIVHHWKSGMNLQFKKTF